MKTLKLFLSVLVSILLLSACSPKQTSINAKELSDDLATNAIFFDELTLTDKKTAEKLYDIKDALNSYVYISSGATAEEIAVFEFEEESNAKQAVEKAVARISAQKDSFESYIPEEVKKLDNAIIKQSGRYLIVCVSDGDEAESILSKYIK